MAMSTRILTAGGLFLFLNLTWAQDRSTSIPVPDSLIAEGIPPIPAAIGDSVSRYTESRRAFFAGWRPGMREMLILTQIGNTEQVYSTAMPGGDRHQLTFFPETIQTAAYSRKNPNWLVFGRDQGGDEFYQLYRYDRTTGRSTLLTDGKSRNTDQIQARDGKHVLYMSTRRTGNDTDLFEVNAEDPLSDHLVTKLAGGGWVALDVTEDNATALIVNQISANDGQLWLVDMKSGRKRRILNPGKKQVAFNNAAFGRGGRSILFTSDEGAEFQQLKRLNLASGKVTVLTKDIPWDVEALAVSRDRSKTAFIVNNQGLSDLYVLKSNGTRSKIGNLPPAVITDLAWADKGDELGFTLDYHRGCDAYSYDLQNKKLVQWTFSESGGLNPADFQMPKLVKWKSFDGKLLSGWLTMPPAKFKGPRPVWVEIHGGPEDEWRPYFIGRYNYYINEMGMAVLWPNVRGSSGFGKSFLKLDNGFLRGNSYKDIGSLLDWLKSQPKLDPKRVFVSGGSYGGNMTYAASYLYADRIALSMPIVGITNLVSFLEHTSGYRRDLRRVEYGDERDPRMRAYLEKIAPINHASEITKPMLIVAGQNDPRVPILEATAFKDRLKTTNPNTWCLVGKDEGHGFVKRNNQDFLMYTTVMFLRRFLFGEGIGK